MTRTTAAIRLAALVCAALALTKSRRAGPPRPPRRRPGPAADGVPVVSPRTPTLGGGAAAPLDA